MAGLVRFFRRSFISPHSRALVQLLQSPTHAIPVGPLNSRIQNPQIQCRNYNGSFYRRFDHSRWLPKEVNGFAVVLLHWEQRVRLEKRFGDGEEIKVEVAMFDPVSECMDDEVDFLVEGEETMYIHITLKVSIFKDGNDKVLVFGCSAYPDNIEIFEIYMRSRGQMPEDPHMGLPVPFKELDEQLQNPCYEFLEDRGIDDDLCGFLHKYLPANIAIY